MKTFEQFIPNCKNFNDKQMEVLKKYYEIYKNNCFDEWLGTIPTEEINECGLETMRKVWEAIEYEDK